MGVAYGKFDPSGPRFSWLLPVSVCVSLLGAGSTVFSFEQATLAIGVRRNLPLDLGFLGAGGDE